MTFHESYMLATSLGQYYWSLFSSASIVAKYPDFLSISEGPQFIPDKLLLCEAESGDVMNGVVSSMIVNYFISDGMSCIHDSQYRLPVNVDHPDRLYGKYYLTPYFRYYSESHMVYVSEAFGPTLRKRRLYQFTDNHLILVKQFRS